MPLGLSFFDGCVEEFDEVFGHADIFAFQLKDVFGKLCDIDCAREIWRNECGDLGWGLGWYGDLDVSVIGGYARYGPWIVSQCWACQGSQLPQVSWVEHVVMSGDVDGIWAGAKESDQSCAAGRGPELFEIDWSEGKVSEDEGCADVLVCQEECFEPVELRIVVRDGTGDIECDDEHVFERHGVIEREVASLQ